MKLNTILIIFSLIFAFGCKNSTENAANQNEKTIKVPADFPDIASAVKSASPGDTIILSPGTYPENSIDIDKAITITSEWKIPGMNRKSTRQ